MSALLEVLVTLRDVPGVVGSLLYGGGMLAERDLSFLPPGAAVSAARRLGRLLEMVDTNFETALLMRLSFEGMTVTLRRHEDLVLLVLAETRANQTAIEMASTLALRQLGERVLAGGLVPPPAARVSLPSVPSRAVLPSGAPAASPHATHPPSSAGAASTAPSGSPRAVPATTAAGARPAPSPTAGVPGKPKKKSDIWGLPPPLSASSSHALGEPMDSASLGVVLSNSFTLVFVAFVACAAFLFLEKDRVPEEFRTTIRVSCVYLLIAAINYYYMRTSYDVALANGGTTFPTAYRYIDWVLTTPLMLLKFPLLLGVGPKGRTFMTRLVVLDLVMIGTGFVGETMPAVPLAHYGLFLVGCLAWLCILALLFQALVTLPDRIGPSLSRGIRTMAIFVVLGWAIYPMGYIAPLLQLPPHARELVYNAADLINKVGLCLVVYISAKLTAKEQEDALELADPQGEGALEQA